eukprot:9418990-Pyramimonas_sp.AAC.1
MSSRILRAIALENYQVSESSEYFIQGKNSTESYAEAAKQYSRDQKQQKIANLAHPHVHVWNAWIAVAKTKLGEKELEPPMLDSLQ